MPINWIRGNAACKATGILQAAFEVNSIVPNTVQAARIEPTYHRVLYLFAQLKLVSIKYGWRRRVSYIVVSVPRCWGYASSMISKGPDPCVIFALRTLVRDIAARVLRAVDSPQTNEKAACNEHAGVGGRDRLDDGADKDDGDSNGYSDTTAEDVGDVSRWFGYFISLCLAIVRYGALQKKSAETPPMF